VFTVQLIIESASHSRVTMETRYIAANRTPLWDSLKYSNPCTLTDNVRLYRTPTYVNDHRHTRFCR